MIRSLVFTQNFGEQDAVHPGIKLTHDRWNSLSMLPWLFFLIRLYRVYFYGNRNNKFMNMANGAG